MCIYIKHVHLFPDVMASNINAHIQFFAKKTTRKDCPLIKFCTGSSQ